MTIPATKHAVQYLSERGITLEQALGLGVDISVSANGSHPRGIYKDRLGFDTWGNRLLPDIVEESIWFPCRDAAGNIKSYFCRVFPPPHDSEGKPVKFLTSKEGSGFPFIVPEVWEAAPKPHVPICIAEGPVKALAVLRAGGLPIGLGGVWMAVVFDKEDRTDLHFALTEFQWRSRKVFLIFDADFEANPSVRQALIRTWIVLSARGADVMILRWPVSEGKGFDDYMAVKAKGEVAPEVLFAEMRNAGVLLPAILERVDLEGIEMELIRSRASGALLEQICRMMARPLGLSSGTLIKGIKEERRKLAAAIPEPLPSVTPRALPEILADVIKTLKRYITFLLPEEQSLALGLWVIHTWLLRAFDYTPYIFIYSPAVRSGKTRVFEALGLMCRNVEQTEGASAAALVRIISDSYVPTFLLDELDTVFGGRKGNAPEAENLRRLLNAGFKRRGTFLRCGWKDKEIIVERFLAFCPKALAAVAQCLPTSVADRSIPIEIKRQGEKKAEKLRDREAVASAASLRDELAVLAAAEELITTLNKARPVMPDKLNDRQQDICEPLLAIAEHIGGDWPEKARASLIKLCTAEAPQEDLRIRLLTDIKEIFDKTGELSFSTQTLIKKLIDIADDAPWPEWFEELIQKEKFQTAASKLARELRPYKIKPVTIWWKSESGTDISAKGYHRKLFEDAWKRYLPSEGKNNATTSAFQATAVRNPDNPLDENEKQPDACPPKDRPFRPQSSGHNPLTEKEVTQVPDGLTAENSSPTPKNISSPKSGEKGEEPDMYEEPFDL